MKRPTLDEHRRLLLDLHHEIENRGRDSGEGALMEQAFETLLWLTVEYLTPDYSPGVKVTIERSRR